MGGTWGQRGEGIKGGVDQLGAGGRSLKRKQEWGWWSGGQGGLMALGLGRR